MPAHDRHLAIAPVAAAAFVVVALFVWPTPYSIFRIGNDVVRVNRLTGVREVSTDAGWRTKEEVADEAAAEKEREKRESLERLRLKQDSLRKRLAGVSIVNDGDDKMEFDKAVIHNPSDWDLDNPSENTVVEYYRLNPEDHDDRQFLCRVETHNFLVKANGHTTLRLRELLDFDGDPEPLEVRRLPEGTRFAQKITVTFSMASNNLGPEPDVVLFRPPFAVTTERLWQK